MVAGVPPVARAQSDERRLADAARHADWGVVGALLEQGADVDAPQGDGTTALHWAAYWDDAESAERLLRAGARINAVNDLGVTPLWMACENGSAAMVERLLGAGASPNAALLSGETLLMTAARTGSPDVVEQLLARGADANAKERQRGQTALMWAAAQQHPDVVEVLLAHDADVQARSNVWTQTVKIRSASSRPPEYITDIQQGGFTPLLFAARVGDLVSAKLLVAAGADVNDTAPYGTSATVVAAHSGHGEVAAFLLEHGADPNAAGAGYTAVHAALLHRDAALVGALLGHGADPNAPVLSSTHPRRGGRDVHLQPAFVGATPFWLAARFGAPTIMRLLAEHGADPLFVHDLHWWAGGGAGNTATERLEGDTTALMAAAGLGDRLLVGAGVVPPAPGELEARTLDAVTVAAALGVDVNAANADGNTALHAVAARGYDTVIEFLVENGATLDVTNNEGQTPLAVATTGSRRLGVRNAGPRRSTAELLRKLGATR